MMSANVHNVIMTFCVFSEIADAFSGVLWWQDQNNYSWQDAKSGRQLSQQTVHHNSFKRVIRAKSSRKKQA